MLPYTNYILLVSIPLIISAVTTPLVRFGAIKNGVVDQPGRHKTHSEAKPLLGGLAIFISVMGALLLMLPLNGKLISLIFASIIVVITGYLDDRFNLKPLVKLAGQLVAAAIVVLANISYLAPLIELFDRFYFPWFVTVLGMILFIALMINAFNLIDGMDGLAAGVSAILFLGMAVKTIVSGGSASILALQLIGFGACIGFLPYNFSPAKIFMGDTGSMLLGFLLSVTFLFSVTANNFSGALVLGAIYIFAYPLLDVTFAIYRRVRGQCSILQADRCHIHHLFQGLGISVRKTAVYIYLVNLFFVTIGVALIYFNADAVVILVAGILTGLAAVLLIRKLANMGVAQGRMTITRLAIKNGKVKVD
jgi:UDP-GlcNAc:undecaprenyl-phosphate/decaprenyl-phosphate GlcNAc-1-phosphate transferase